MYYILYCTYTLVLSTLPLSIMRKAIVLTGNLLLLGPDATKYLTIVVVKNLPLLCVGRRNLWYVSISADRVTRDKHFGTIFDAIRGLCGLQNACKTVLGNCSPPQVPNNIVEMLIFFYIINFITQQLLLILLLQIVARVP